MFFTVGYVTYMVVALLVVLGVAIATKKKIVYSRGGYISHESQLKIEPLKDFDWETTEPLKFRPFKPTYHITMGKFLSQGNHTPSGGGLLV
ncbi:hypothetical protein BX600DRAFT_478233 [Xylariales sp. PMI_506]|nr:hypothetical protein BX600DRAFT_478233 [Xylariales sp. PMI_506]